MRSKSARVLEDQGSSALELELSNESRPVGIARLLSNDSQGVLQLVTVEVAESLGSVSLDCVAA